MREKIEKWYKQSLWSEQMVLNAVGKVLTYEQAHDIISKKE